MEPYNKISTTLQKSTIVFCLKDDPQTSSDGVWVEFFAKLLSSKGIFKSGFVSKGSSSAIMRRVGFVICMGNIEECIRSLLKNPLIESAQQCSEDFLL